MVDKKIIKAAFFGFIGCAAIHYVIKKIRKEY